MIRQPFLHEVLKQIVKAMQFPVEYAVATNNTDGTYTLEGIKNLRHIQPAFTINIGGNDFVVKDYEQDADNDCFWKLILEAGSNALPTTPGTFNVYPAYFYHGTPQQQEVEFKKIPLDYKAPMLYLIEPYETEEDEEPSSSIASRSTMQLCFLTYGEILQWETDKIYHTLINPMRNLAKQFFRELKASNLFYMDEQKLRPKYHTKFSIYVPDPTSKTLYFSENLAGLSVMLRLEMYKLDPCRCCDAGSVVLGAFDLSFDESFDV